MVIIPFIRTTCITIPVHLFITHPLIHIDHRRYHHLQLPVTPSTIPQYRVRSNTLRTNFMQQITKVIGRTFDRKSRILAVLLVPLLWRYRRKCTYRRRLRTVLLPGGQQCIKILLHQCPRDYKYTKKDAIAGVRIA